MRESKINWIDIPTWDRAMHYQVFRNIPQPQYCVTFELDITQFLPRIRKKGTHLPFPWYMPLPGVPARWKLSGAGSWMGSLLSLIQSTPRSHI